MNNKQLATPLCNCVARFTSTGHNRPDGGLVLYEDYYKLQAQAEKLAEALKFECGNRCAEQNPCNAKDALSEWGKFKAGEK